MTDNSTLANLFSEFNDVPKDSLFTAKVMKKSRFSRYRLQILLVIITMILFGFTVFISQDLQSTIIKLNIYLSANIFELDKGIASVFLQPINSISGLVIILGRIIYTIFKWLK